MSRLAPGRKGDMARLVKDRDNTRKYTHRWSLINIKIQDILAEGKDDKLYHLRERLLNATLAGDLDETDKISEEIREHVRRTAPYRFYRGWIRKEY